MIESDAELLARYRAVRDRVTKAEKSLSRMTSASSRRDDKARWLGCLNFTLLGIEREIEERGLSV